MSNIDPPRAWCHLCNCVAEEEFYIDHLSIHHPTLLFVLYATHLPLTQVNYVNNLPFYMNQILYDYDIGPDVDNSDYETLLALCNEIGDHKIGIEDVRERSIVVSDKDAFAPEDSCPICIEPFATTDYDIYILNVCNHAYCAECIERWCTENKTCPVCKVEIV